MAVGKPGCLAVSESELVMSDLRKAVRALDFDPALYRH
nr:MAG TPA_asm: hypothetical protein [Caudoviricetes sp.]